MAGWPIIVASSALFVIEFFADKIPAFDLIWNALHTFIRVPVAGLLAYQATQPAFSRAPTAGHTVRSGRGSDRSQRQDGSARGRDAFPEPFSNITLSLGEDVLAIGLTWLATRHPYVAGTLATIFIAIILLLTHWVIRAMRALFRGAERELAG